jgi:hypothetical protein
MLPWPRAKAGSAVTESESLPPATDARRGIQAENRKRIGPSPVDPVDELARPKMRANLRRFAQPRSGARFGNCLTKSI